MHVNKIKNDIVITFICKFLEKKDVISFLTFFDCLRKYEYIYTEYFKDEKEPLNKKIIRHLNIHDTLNMHIYSGLLTIKFDDFFNEQIYENTLPNTIENIYFGYNFNQRLHPFPSSLRVIKFGHLFDQEIDENVFPKIMFSIEFGYRYNKELKQNVLPDELNELKFGKLYTKALEPGVIRYLKRLFFDCAFEINYDFNMNTFCDSLEELYLGSGWIPKIRKNTLPKNLKILHLNGQYNNPIDKGVLPESLTELTFNWNHSYPLDVYALPKSLKKLTLGKSYNMSWLSGQHFVKLEELTLGFYFNNYVDNIPYSLKKLTFGYAFNAGLNNNFLYYTNLIELKFGHNFDKKIYYLPRHLKKLTFGWCYNQRVFSNNLPILPDSLEVLVFGHNFNKILIEERMPKNLKELVLGYGFNKILRLQLFRSLDSITFHSTSHYRISMGNFLLTDGKYYNTECYGLIDHGLVFVKNNRKRKIIV